MTHRVYVNLPEEIWAELRRRQEMSGATVSWQINAAVKASLQTPTSGQAFAANLKAQIPSPAPRPAPQRQQVAPPVVPGVRRASEVPFKLTPRKMELYCPDHPDLVVAEGQRTCKYNRCGNRLIARIKEES